MSRRKQARPVKLLEEDGVVQTPPADSAATQNPPTHGESSASCSEEDASCGIPASEADLIQTEPLMCPRCQEQFTEVPEFLAHKTACEQKAERHQDTAHSDPEDMVVSEYDDDDEDEDGTGKRLEQARRHRQDAANNNSVDEDGSERDMDNIRIGFPFPLPTPSASHVTLEALQNTKVAVAQFAATAMANNTDNEAALQELAVLQSTLFTLQHQQVFQLQLINQLQQQLSINRSKESSPTPPTPSEDTGGPATTIDSPPHEPTSSSPRAPSPIAPQSTPPVSLTFNHQNNQPPPPIKPEPAATEAPVVTNTVNTTPPIHANNQPPYCSISSSLAASIITNNDPLPSQDEPNTLEMLQRRAQEVLDNASQGLLANNLADELAFRKSKGSMSPYDSKSGRNEPFFKHRCRYCGKVFGSDSALQIHIRSHTGERPFKCNVCGSRFTTKGNLKVHFQRHTAKFPHIKMNPNPVPEHLDKYHPPLLAQMGQQGALSPGGPVHHTPHPFTSAHPFPPTSIPIYRPSIPPPELLQNRLQPSPHRPQDLNTRILPPHPLFVRREEQDVPADLSKPARSPPPANIAPESKMKTEPVEEKRELNDEPKMSPINNTITPKQEMDIDNEHEHEHEHELNEQEHENERYQSPPPYDECSMDSKYSNEDLLRRSPMMEHGENMQEEPENLSNKVNSITVPLSISTGQRLPASFNFPHASSPPSSTSSGSLGPFSTQSSTDPAKDPAVYASLLPRPGSNDNSWESLIEVTKTSETSKLQQLVDNIEHKLTDPNQCVICHRVLSCKSALQMHYRTHTGERPFKCKICGRAFTTKGNLKTHMGVHRAKPPMRVLHQCPVCHKKFTNALVLQQHIRLHTGEPTDLTPEQIQAAEIKDFPSPGGFPSLPNSMNPFLAGSFSVPNLAALNAANLPLNMKASDIEAAMKMESEYCDDDDDDDDDMMSTSEHTMTMPSFSTSLAALENQVRTITTMASQLTASNCSAEDLCSRTIASTPTPQNGDKSPTQSGIISPNGSEIRSSPNHMPVQVPRPPSSNHQPNSPSPSESNSLGALDLTPRSTQPPAPSPGPSPGPPPMFSNFGLLPPSQGSSPLMSSALSSLTSSVLTSTAFSPLGLAVGPAGAFAPIRGNTTCNICFKTFACNSALEIHYRSHTKERPFKCTVCDRGFSTKNRPECTCGQGQRRIQDGGGQKPRRVRKKKPPSTTAKNVATKFPPLTMNPGYATAFEWSPLLGNMKQHMLTHKIRDMPQHMFDKPGGVTPQPVSSIADEPPAVLRDLVQQQQQQQQREREQREREQLQQRDLPQPQSQQQQQQQQQQQPPPPPLPLPLPLQQQHHPETEQQPPIVVLPPPPLEMPIKAEMSIKRATSESELPIPKRPPNVQSSKHLCHVCNKNFSSSSALQIHMRTHTGDKPFRCTVCQKAFTTKGNLKVHMGTHMWSNGASRRGRRMSLDLPPIPMTPKDSEFLQRRPDLFYPYLPAPFLNGMQQKLNEISVIQNASNGLPNAGKYTGLLGFGYPPPDAVHAAQPESPISDKPAAPSPGRESVERADRDRDHREREVLPRVWDLHYERKAAAEQAMEARMDVSPSTVVPAQPPPLNLQPPPRGEGLAA